MSASPRVLRTTILAALLGTGSIADAGIMTYTPMSGDADSGINSLLNYTAKANFFGDSARTVNGVTFTDLGFSGTGYSLTGPDNTLRGGTNNVGGEIGAVIGDFYFGPGDGNATMTLTGLSVGTQYVTTWYNRGWGAAGGRFVLINASDTPDGVFRIDQNFTGDGNGNLIRYTFTATATTQTYAIDAVSNGDSFHHYALTNAVRNDAILPLAAAPVAPRVSSLNGNGPQTPAGVSGTDLLQTQLANAAVNGTINNTEGTGGVGVLTDGSFTAGAGNGAYFAPEAGASVTFSLNTTTNAFGYDISSVRGFGGWNDNGRDRQNFSLYYSVVGDAGFTFLGTVDYDVAIQGGLTSTITSVFDTALKNVDGIRVDFLSPQENGYVGYGEFDVIGTASVPEPGSSLLLLSAAPLLLLRRRRA